MELAELDAHRGVARTAAGEVSYVDVGSGPPAVFLHGLGTNAYLWRHVIGALAGERRCVAVDLPVHGRSRAAAGQDLSLNGLADAVRGTLDALGLDRVDLVGNDTGGALAQMLAARTPQLLRTLTLTNCETDGNIPNPSFRGTIGWAAEGTLAPRLVGMYERLEQTAPQQRPLAGGHERPQDLPIAVHRAYLEPIAGRLDTARDFERMLVAIDPEHLRAAVPGLRELTVPTLVVWGNADPHYGMDWAYWLRDTIPGVTEVVELDGAKLFLPDERAGNLVACLRRHWAAAGEPTGDPAGDPAGDLAGRS